jgi:hypothetical protein
MRKMKLRERRVGLLVLTVMLFASLAAAQTPLQPLVIRSNEQRGVEPAECAEGLDTAPVPPRVTVRDVPIPDPDPEDVPPPPSSALRGNLEELQRALVRNDRPAFDESLARVRAIIDSYPRGGERSAAEDVLRVYSDAARLWDAQYTSPFFGAGSPEYDAVSGYPGYAEAVRRATFTDAAGDRFYPAAESRAFLANVAAQRLQRLGVRTAAVPPARGTHTDDTPRAIASMTPPRTTDRGTSASPRSTTRDRTTARGTTTSGTTISGGTSTTRTAPRSTRSTPRGSSTATRKPAAATSTRGTRNPAAPATASADDVTDSDSPPAEIDEPVSTNTGTTPSDVVDTDTDTAVTGSAPTTGTAGITNTAPITGTAMTDTAITSPDTSATDAETTSAPKRPVFLATILILIGLGVLIVLFRASR